MVSAKEWLDQNCPKEERKNAYGLTVKNGNLEGHLDLSDFINLRELSCSHNKLTSIDLSNNRELKSINCSDNLLTDIDFSHQDPEKMKKINIKNNDLSSRDLSCFSRFVNLEKLLLGTDDEEKLAQNIYNRFHGSLQHLMNLGELEELDINGTDIDDGLEDLSVRKLRCFYCAKKRDGAKVEEFKNILEIDEEQAESLSMEDNKEKISRIIAFKFYAKIDYDQYSSYIEEMIETKNWR